MKIKGAIFDMDGTLVDSLMLWDIIWKAFGVKFLNDPTFRPDKIVDKAVRTLPLKEAMEHLHINCQIGDNGESLFKLANEIMKNFYANEVKLKKGVKEFLKYCYENDVKMCIASATAPELVCIALKHCDIEKYFSKCFSCSDSGKGKEHPDVFLHALNYLQTPIEETWVFEDSTVALTTAHNAGFSTVGIYDKYNYEQNILKEMATVYIGENEDLRKLIL